MIRHHLIQLTMIYILVDLLAIDLTLWLMGPRREDWLDGWLRRLQIAARLVYVTLPFEIHVVLEYLACRPDPKGSGLTRSLLDNRPDNLYNLTS